MTPLDTQTLAITALREGDFTCAIAHEGKVIFTSQARGVKPLVDYYHQYGNGYPGAALADKVIGRAAALLVRLCGITQVYADVMSASAQAELEQAGIHARFQEQVEAIRNRTNTGLCPMEQLSQGVETPEEMLSRVEEFLKNLPQT